MAEVATFLFVVGVLCATEWACRYHARTIDIVTGKCPEDRRTSHVTKVPRESDA